jgi:hypothetical protein
MRRGSALCGRREPFKEPYALDPSCDLNQKVYNSVRRKTQTRDTAKPIAADDALQQRHAVLPLAGIGLLVTPRPVGAHWYLGKRAKT